MGACSSASRKSFILMLGLENSGKSHIGLAMSLALGGSPVQWNPGSANVMWTSDAVTVGKYPATLFEAGGSPAVRELWTDAVITRENPALLVRRCVDLLGPRLHN
jgi:hypothetical protein